MECYCASITECINVFLHGRNEQVLSYFSCQFDQNRASMSLIKTAGRNRIFSPLGIEAKLIENLLPLGLEDDELTSINDLNMQNY